MKKLYFLLLPFLLAAACDNAPEPTPADKLPLATMTGANTFGCLVNGGGMAAVYGSFLGPGFKCGTRYLLGWM